MTDLSDAALRERAIKECPNADNHQPGAGCMICFMHGGRYIALRDVVRAEKRESVDKEPAMTLAELRALCERATPGPWKKVTNISGDYDVFDAVLPGFGAFIAGRLNERDADFIAAARIWLLALIEVAEAAKILRHYAPGTAVFAKHWVNLLAALARLDEAGRP